MINNKNSTTVISISIIIVCLLILFNFVDIANNIESPEKPQEAQDITKQSKITGHIVFNMSDFSISKDSEIEVDEEELKSLKVKTFFYAIIVVVAIIIVNLLIIVILFHKDRKELEEAGE